MDTQVRQQLADLIGALDYAPREYSFFQLVNRLEQGCVQAGLPGDALDRWLTFAPSRDLGFPPSDVLACRPEDGQIRIELGFMGLYGVDAPLPHYFLDMAAGDDPGSEVLRGFLDLFSHRFYALLYRAWRKYRPHLHGLSGGGAFARYFAAVAGSYGDRGQHTLAYAGLFGARRRTAAALAGMLTEWLDGLPVDVRQFQPVWVRLSERGGLGSPEGMHLGEDTMLGDSVLDRAGRISLEIGPLNVDALRPLLPGSERGVRLCELAGRYLGPAFGFDLVFLVRPSGGISRLGDDQILLGSAGWLGAPEEGSIYRVRMPASAYRDGGSQDRTNTRSDA